MISLPYNSRIKGVKIVQAKFDNEIEEIRKLFREYETFLNVDLQFQNFEEELAALPGKYAPPEGILLLAMNGDKGLGCGALRRFGQRSENICEMKRLFVLPRARGLGLGRRLALMIIQAGARVGYSRMVLDTLEGLVQAMSLYESIGFVRTDPYYENPLPGAVYWSLDLDDRPNDINSVRLRNG
jgi:GNAT superfamily N-acetyltransferase